LIPRQPDANAVTAIMKKTDRRKAKLKLDTATIRVLDAAKLVDVAGGSGWGCNINPSNQVSCTKCTE
jgi:hypothetical protein